MIKFLSSLVITILLLSCAVEKEKLTENVGKYVPPNIDDTNFKNTVITNKNFEETWTSVIDFVDDSFFKIENLEKDSGLLTLSFGSKEAENFIDCGDFEYTLFFTGEEFKGSYIDYVKSGLLAVLEAKMNINIQNILAFIVEIGTKIKFVNLAVSRIMLFEISENLFYMIGNIEAIYEK